jgi:uncharacterized protein (TIGR03437 family)
MFDDEAGAAIGSVCPPGAAPFRPTEALRDFDGKNTFGTWALKIEDREQNGFVGFLTRYSIRFTAVRVTAPTIALEGLINEATNLPGPIVPGELISIIGAALGPTQTVSATPDPATGAYPVELGGVRVRIGDRDAPVLLASVSRIKVQVPWETPPGVYVNLQTSFSGQQSNVISVPVYNSMPGLFTNDTSGIGYLKAINQNGTLNSVANPARRGEVIIVYATGLGATTPVGITGRPAPNTPLSTAVFPVRAAVGTAQAPVLFAGLAPGMLGVYQLNISIPASILPQLDAPLVIESDGRPSRLSTFIAVQ